MKTLIIGITSYNNNEFLYELLYNLSTQLSLYKLETEVEVFIYDDCSTCDDTKKILQKYCEVFSCHISNKNSGGPSTGRNYILDNTCSKYVLFIDADDVFLGDLQILFSEIGSREEDIIVSNMQKVGSDGAISYSTMIYSWKLFEEHKNIKELVVHQTGIWSIYKREFLNTNNIRYSTKMRYEDNILFYMILSLEPTIGLLKHKYYGWRNNYSSFSYSVASVENRINMVEYVLENLDVDSKYTPYIVFSMWNQTISNIIRKYPKMSRAEYQKYFKQLIKVFFKHTDIMNKTYETINFDFTDIFFHLSKNKLLRSYYVLMIFRLIKRIKNNTKKIKCNILKVFCLVPMSKKKVFFTSHYGNYNDNSKYKYLEMKNDPRCADYKFIFAVKPELTELWNEDMINYHNRILFFYHHYTSKEVYFNSWYNPHIKKRKGQVWTQLWHGYPYKKVHTDINTYDKTFSPLQKLERNNAIKKWDNVISLDENNNKIFSSIFENINIINEEYPKIKFLIDNKNNEKLINTLKNKFGILENKKYVLYAPTYRPYKVFIDLKELPVPNDYTLIINMHPHMNYKIIGHVDAHDVGEIEDIQELILCVDALITDCSSIRRDFELIDKPIYESFEDKELYEVVHGLY